MLGSIGMGELLIIFVIALIVFGPRKLPELGRTLGKSLGEFKRASNDLRNTLEEEIHVEDQTRGLVIAASSSAPQFLRARLGRAPEMAGTRLSGLWEP